MVYSHGTLSMKPILLKNNCSPKSILIAIESLPCLQSHWDVSVGFSGKLPVRITWGDCSGSFEWIEKDPLELNYFAITDHLTGETLVLPHTVASRS